MKKYIGLIIYIIAFIISSRFGRIISDYVYRTETAQDNYPELGLALALGAIMMIAYFIHLILFSIYSLIIIYRNKDYLTLKLYDNFLIPTVVLLVLFIIDTLYFIFTNKSWTYDFADSNLLSIKFLFPIYFISLINATRISENKILCKLKIPIYILLGVSFVYFSKLWHLILAIIDIFIK